MNRIFFRVMILSALAVCMVNNAADASVKDDFEQRRAELGMPGSFEVFDRELTEQQREALEFLYAYMAVPDISDNSGDFFLENVNATLKAREEMPWGKTVPDLEFRHFVLPLRVNNEMLDSSRMVFYKELKPRVENLSMEDAILEVNHWCHEKATYQPSDARTHSPLATVYTAIGRCGEESTFLVAALRAVGIPARQIYTPRWGHTDDNHAWVEAWANGKWYFLGACEPEPVLNLGWFNAPASRGMLMNARVFGVYNGSEEKLLAGKDYTHINTTDHYAPVDTLKVRIVDADGRPVDNAKVDFCLYNYAEYYPLVTKQSDASGRASLIAGCGDLIIWASKDDKFGFAKVSVGKDGENTVALNRSVPLTETVDFDLVPPAARKSEIELSQDLVDENNRRKALEDSIRGAYTSTFVTNAQAAAIARHLSLDEGRVCKVMADARANHEVIRSFLESAAAGADRERALRIVELISAKDRSDITANVLQSHFEATDNSAGDFVLNPRVANETLTPYRIELNTAFLPSEIDKFRDNPADLVAWVTANIQLIPDWNPASVTMNPVSVMKTRKANAASRDIFFVALARSLGMPARLDAVTGKTQWLDKSGAWVDVAFEDNKHSANAPQGVAVFDFTPVGRIDNPRYYTQFSISRIGADGSVNLLNYDEDATYSDTFSKGITLDTGTYMLTTGQRMAGGDVLARSTFFNVNPGDTTHVELAIRQDASGVQVIGGLDAEKLYHDMATGTDKSILSTTGRGYYILGLIDPNHEPTNHALRDIARVKSEFESWGRPMLLLYADSNAAMRQETADMPQLPSTVVTGTDIDGKISDEICSSLKLNPSEKPIFIIADTFNRIVFVSQGYTINLGDTLCDIIHKLD